VAGAWSVPLVLLDPARLYSKYIGESEERLNHALDSLDAVKPAVLWIDEIEKGFAAGSGDGGTSKRLLGSFLRWMQERPPGLFVVATANDVQSLPPEFLRKGRFDEIFFVDLPTAAARHDIWLLQLAKREQVAGRFDLPRLVELSEGYSGAEIEVALVGSLYRAFAADRDLAQADIEAEIIGTVPLSVSRGEEVAALRNWAGERAVEAE
jgi:SpoVK/Ycf46/Vps4 family AAA+-type ATPase